MSEIVGEKSFLELENLSKSYGRAVILKEINLRVMRGEVMALIGPTGSGKTTLLRLINLLEEPTTGRIMIEDQDISALSERGKITVRRRMAMVFQKPVMFKADVENNVSFGLRMRGKGDSAKVREALAMVGLSGYERRDANTLSGGEMQRIALARALILQPQLLLLDEPTANLDPKSVDAIDRLLEGLAKGRTTVILATHNMQEAHRLADRVAVLQEGRLTAIGHPDEIFGSQNVMERTRSEISAPW